MIVKKFNVHNTDRMTGKEYRQAAMAADAKENRKRLSGTEIDSVITLCVSRQLITDVTIHMERFSRSIKIWAMLKCVEGMLRKCIRTCGANMTYEQLTMVGRNINDTDVIISSNPDQDHPRQMINIRRDHLTHLVNQSSRVCSLTCLCNREESKYCQLRAVFDAIPGLKGLANENAFNDHTVCKYQTLTIEEGDLK